MTSISKLLGRPAASPNAIDEIAEKMQPIDEASMRLPRKFAHAIRQMLEEAGKQGAKKMEASKE